MPSGVVPDTLRARFASRFGQAVYTDTILQAAIDVAERQTDECVWGGNFAEAVLLEAAHYAYTQVEVADGDGSMVQSAATGGESVTFRDTAGSSSFYLDLKRRLRPLGDDGGALMLGVLVSKL